MTACHPRPLRYGCILSPKRLFDVSSSLVEAALCISIRGPTRSSRPNLTAVSSVNSHICDNGHGSAAAYNRNCEVLDAAYQVVNDGLGMFLDHTPQLIPVILIHLDG